VQLRSKKARKSASLTRGALKAESRAFKRKLTGRDAMLLLPRSCRRALHRAGLFGYVTKTWRKHELGNAECVESMLYHCLQAVTPMQRKSMLQCSFSQPQRLALEKWMLQHRRLCREGSGAKQKSMEDCARSSMRLMCHEEEQSAPSPSRHVETQEGNMLLDKPLFGMVASSRRRLGRTSYRAKLAVGPFFVATSYSEDVDEIQARVKALLHMRRAFLAALQAPAMESEGSSSTARDDAESSYRAVQQAFKQALTVLQQEEASGCEAGGNPWHVRFFATVPAKAWVGRTLSTPCYATTATELQTGLDAWKVLAIARGAVYQGQHHLHAADEDADAHRHQLTWSKLRQAYVQIWTHAGRCPQKVEEALQRLERKKLHGMQPSPEPCSASQMEHVQEDADVPSDMHVMDPSLQGGQPGGSKSANEHSVSNTDIQFAAQTCIQRLLRHWVVRNDAFDHHFC